MTAQKMKKSFSLWVLLLASLTLLTSHGALADEPLPIEKINELATQTQKRYAPDKTLALFQVKIHEETNTLEVESTDTAAIAEFERRLKQENITVAVDSRPLPTRELAGNIYGVATLSVCNNRVAPANAAEMSTQMLLGTPVDVLKRERGYYLVRTPDRYLAWTDDDGIRLMDAASFQKWQSAEKIVFTAEFGHSYTEPSETAPRVSDLVSGNILEVVGKIGNFLKVRYPDQRLAYVSAHQTMPFDRWCSRKNPDAKAVIETAKTLMGVPYLWGGTSIKGVDCSGFTKTAFFLQGIILPRDASQQALTGENVDIAENGALSVEKCIKNLMPGDLLFFGRARPSDETPRITHTALYLGKGEFIQAAGQVRINSLLVEAPNYDAVRAKTLLSARRVLTAISTPEITRVDHHSMYGASAR